MKAYTDYPIEELGDIFCIEAPIRKVEILSYDNDKHCKVFVNGIIKSIKRGYLFHTPGRAPGSEPISHNELKKLNGKERIFLEEKVSMIM